MEKSFILKCPITDLPVIGSDIFNQDLYQYSIKLEGHKETILIPKNYTEWLNDPVFNKNKHLIAGILLNEHIFNFNGEYHTLSIDRIKNSFDESLFPRTPQEKYDNLLQELFKLQEYEGASIEILNRFRQPEFYYRLYFKNYDELVFYIKTLQSDNLINAKFIGNVDYGMEQLNECSLTYRGLSYVLRLMDEGKQSKNCFIAMSFGNEMHDIRTAIKAACDETGYTPIIVDENADISSETTINDAIIANLKKCRFYIADFTEQKDGVYFESGFALGQGKQVIYTCQKEWFGKAHFDTNHFPHIVYETPEDLKVALINKIEAWVR